MLFQARFFVNIFKKQWTTIFETLEYLQSFTFELFKKKPVKQEDQALSCFYSRQNIASLTYSVAIFIAIVLTHYVQPVQTFKATQRTLG